MATTYSTSLKLSLIGDGEQSGTWGQTTNLNLGTLLEQAITGVVSITMSDANYTMTDFNGVSDEARNAVLLVGGSNTAQRDLIAPAVEKLYVVKNSTGQNLRIKTSGGTAVTIPNGLTTCVYCDGTDFYEQQTGTAGAFTVTGNATVGGTLGVTGALTGTTGSFSGDVTFPTQSAGNNTTKAATTAFVTTALTNLNLGTMATQNSNNVSITGGTINSLTVTSLGTNGYGTRTVSASSPTGGADGDIWYQI